MTMLRQKSHVTTTCASRTPQSLGRPPLAGFHLALLALLPFHLKADTFDWSEAAFFNNNFSDPDNWFEKAVPKERDDCRFVHVFGLGAENVVNYDIAGSPRYNLLRFTGPFQVTGGRIGARVVEVLGYEGSGRGEGNVTFSGGLFTRDGVCRISLNHGGLVRIHGLVADSETHLIPHKDNLVTPFDFPVAGPASVIEVLDGISGAGPLLIDSPLGIADVMPDSHVAFRSANTFTGPLTVDGGGTLKIYDSAALGSAASGTTIEGGNLATSSEGRLEIEMSVARTIAEPLTVGGVVRTFVDGTGPGATLTLTGPVVGQGIFNLSSPIRFNTSLSGLGDCEFSGSTGQLVTLSGSSANTLNGDIESSCDILLDKPAGVDAVKRGLHLRSNATATWNRSNQLADLSKLLLENGTADLNGNSETLAEVIFFGSGTVKTGTTGSLRVNRSIVGNLRQGGRGKIGGKLLFGAANIPIAHGADPTDFIEISATATPAFAGAGFSVVGGSGGTLRITGVCSAPAVINCGNLEVNSTSPLMTVTLNQGGGEGGTAFPADVAGTLSGTGTVGAVTAGSGGGLVSPGGKNPGILRCGNLALNAESTFRADIDGTTPGTGFDQLRVTGTVSLNGAALVIDNVFVPNGSSCTIIENDGTDPVSGTFAGLPQGAKIGGFRISYRGGTGNDVTLVRSSLPSGVTRTWTGLGADANWSTSANWSPAVHPQDGDALVFPAGASRRTNINNLTNLGLRSLTFSGGPYRISGNPIALSEGISATGAVPLTHTLSINLALLEPQAFTVGNHVLGLGGAIDTNGMPLAFQTQGNATTSVIFCSGVISEGAADQFTKTGAGQLTLTNANTTRGIFHILAGTVEIRNSAALGSRLGVTKVDKGAQLTVAGTDLAINETILLGGTLRIANNAGEPGFGDPIVCGDAAEIFVSSTGVTQCNVFDEIQGSRFTKTGPGTLNLTGAKAKSLGEGITIDEGRVLATGTAGTILLPGDTTVGVSPLRAAVLEIRQRRVTEPDSRFIVNEGGGVICASPEIAIAGLTLKGGSLATDANGLALNGPLETLPSSQTAVLTGRITLPDGTSEWIVADGPAGDDLRVDALLRKEPLTDANLRQSGLGRVVFNAANTISAATFQGGTNVWNSLSDTVAANITGGTLSGTGRFLSLSVGGAGVIAPGGSPGVFTTGSLDMEGGGTLRIELNGTTPGSGHDQIRCTTDPSNANLGGGRLEVVPGLAHPAGAAFTVIDLKGAGAIVPFAGLPQNSTILSGSQRFRIDYFGGDGNDVTLTALAQGPVPALQVGSFAFKENAAGDLREISGTVSGGIGAEGLGIVVEISGDLLEWTPLPLRFADEKGEASFVHTVRTSQAPKVFFRARISP